MEKKRTKRSAVLYEMRIEIEELDDAGDYRYLATSPDLKNLIVVGDTVKSGFG